MEAGGSCTDGRRPPGGGLMPTVRLYQTGSFLPALVTFLTYVCRVFFPDKCSLFLASVFVSFHYRTPATLLCIAAVVLEARFVYNQLNF